MYNSSQGGNISAYLTKKRLGGEVNQKGNEYELYYACNLICLFAAKYPNELDKVFISSQAVASVDDLYIDYNNKTHHYYQLKTSKYLNWHSRKKSSSNNQNSKSKSFPLKFDFWLQSNWCKLKNQRCKLHLVVSEKSVQQQMISTKPIMMPNVSVDLFSYETTITRLLYDNIEFRKRVASLCAISIPTFETLASVASCIIGIWNCGGKKNISLNDLLSKVKSISGSYVKYPLFPNVKISAKLDSILKSIKNFSYTVDNDVFIWQYGLTDYGKSPYNVSSAEFAYFENKVILSKPNDFQALEKLLILLS